jgi:SagB-type dehydrogenase family enzyme
VTRQYQEKNNIPFADEVRVWELFHENSKTQRYRLFPPDEYVLARMERMAASLQYDTAPTVVLPTSTEPLAMSLGEAINRRVTARALQPCSLTLATVATLLQHAYGITRDNQDTHFPRPFRTVPSGGALYPLEIYFYSTHIQELEAGLYHYNPSRNEVQLLRAGDAGERLAEALVQREIATDAALLVFVTAIFERSTFKYGERGYRFILLEAGHVAQNANLVASALGLGCVNIGGFFDRQIDELLGLDGVTHSTIYMIALGANQESVALTEMM